MIKVYNIILFCQDTRKAAIKAARNAELNQLGFITPNCRYAISSVLEISAFTEIILFCVVR